jgi:hypothetical protein
MEVIKHTSVCTKAILKEWNQVYFLIWSIYLLLDPNPHPRARHCISLSYSKL